MQRNMNTGTGTKNQGHRDRQTGTNGLGEGWGQRQGQMDLVRDGDFVSSGGAPTALHGTLMFMMMKISTHIKV